VLNSGGRHRRRCDPTAHARGPAPTHSPIRVRFPARCTATANWRLRAKRAGALVPNRFAAPARNCRAIGRMSSRGSATTGRRPDSRRMSSTRFAGKTVKRIRQRRSVFSPPTTSWPSIARRGPAAARPSPTPRRHRRTARQARERLLSRPSHPQPPSTPRNGS